MSAYISSNQAKGGEVCMLESGIYLVIFEVSLAKSDKEMLI